MTIADLARPEVRTLPLYSIEAVECAVDVSDNTSLWGPSPAALRALGELPPSVAARYPSPYSSLLREPTLRYLQLDSARSLDVVFGCGSDDVLDSAMRAFGAYGNRLAYSAPTFSMIPTFARLNGIETIAIPLADNLDVDAERLVACDAAITYICAPNNPTATPVSRDAVEHVVTHARGLVIIDEAYAEFAPETFADLAASSERVLVTRTFSKAFGLAGLRVGYGVGSSSVISLVARARGPYKVNAMAERAALASLQSGDDALGWVRRHAGLAVEMRQRLAQGLRDLGLAPLPSAANFVLVPLAEATAVAERMAKRGVLVRAFVGMPRDLPAFVDSHGAALRISVGPWDMLQRVLETLREVM